MGLRDIGATLPPGFRFYPSDEELICHYLYKKIANEEVVRGTLMEIDLHTCEPWQLPDSAKLNSSEWYFFSFRDRKYATGYRTNRATTSGYWKATGKDRTVVDPGTRSVVGMRKTLVFYKNRAPNGIKTGWIMHEFRLENPHVPPKEDWVLCRVFYKSRCENGTQNIYDQDNYLNLNTSCPNLDDGFQNIISSFFSNGPSLQNPSASGDLGSGFDYQMSQYNHDLINGPGRDPSSSTTPRCEDDYGFLFDMNFDDDSNGVIMS